MSKTKKPSPPTRKTEKVIDTVLSRVAAGESIVAICSDADMPSQKSWYKWLSEDTGDLGERYVRARDVQADAIFDEILQIADDAANDYMERTGEGNEGWQLHGEHVQRSRLRIDARKWMAGKLAPKKYGDKIAVELTDSLSERFARAAARGKAE